MTQRHPIKNDVFMMITTNTHHRVPVFEDPTRACEAIESLYRVQEHYLFHLYGFVIMPDHCHFLLRVPPPGTISRVMNVYKGTVAASIGIGPIWQRRFHIRLPSDSYGALNYIHQNPVKAAMVKHDEDYPWSSACGKWDVDELVV